MKYYVGIHKDNNVYNNSSSGGAFTAITDYLYSIYDDLIIYGCVLDENLDAVHIRGVNIEDRNKMRGSKYISSRLGDSYSKVFSDLKNNKNVVFTGTPCQVAGLKQFLRAKKIDISKLITIDFVCHGVGDNRFFKDYIKDLENKYNSNAISCKFRGKTKPGKFQDMVVEFENKKKYIASTTNLDWFYSVYHSNLILRSSCYDCKFTNNKYSDITLGDDWSLNRDTIKAHSLIIANTNVGEKIITNLNDFYIKQVDKKDINQPNTEHASLKPSNYDEFWNIYNSKGYLEAQKYFGNNTLKGKIKVKIANIVDRLGLRRLIRK